MIDKVSKIVKFILCLLIVTICTKSCNAQKDSFSKKIECEPQTEHMYGVKPQNDTLIVFLFKTTMSKEEIRNSSEGKAFLEITLDSGGNVILVLFKILDDFFISESIQNQLSTKIIEQVKFELSEDAINYYAIINKNVTLIIGILGSSLQ